ncbi:MAG: hypothetical protein ACOYB4_07530, partial [Methyloceanibacter sp.]
MRSRLPRAELLRRLVPILLIAFAAVAFTGFIFQIVKDKRTAIDAGRHQLMLLADVTALHLKDHTLGTNQDWQAALASSLPKGALRNGRTAILAGPGGNIQARVPSDGTPGTNLLAILGPQQPLTILGVDAGVLRMTLPDGTDAIVTVRDVP